MKVLNRLPGFARVERLVFTLVVLCFTCATIAAQNEIEHVVAGQFLDADGQPSDEALVAVCKFAADVADGDQTRTDSNGNFTIKVTATPQHFEAMRVEAKNRDGTEIGYVPL